MDVIVAYLDTMFTPYPDTPRMAEAKAELRAMMEDAYTELIAQGRSQNEAVGQVITEFGNLDELAATLGISAEVHGATSSAQMGSDGVASSPAPTAAAPTYAPVTLPEAQAYAGAVHSTRYRVAGAVAAFVVSPALLIPLTLAGSNPRFPLSSDAGVLIGVIVLLMIVAAGVAVLVGTARELSPFQRISEGHFSPDAQVSAWASALKASVEAHRVNRLALAVGLWILAAVPTLVTALLSDEGGPLPEESVGVGVALTLIIVAIGLVAYLPAGWAATVANQLVEAGTATTADEQPSTSITGMIAGVYWPLAAAVYLGWSFIGDAWDRSWVIWPIAGVLFAAILIVSRTLEARSRRES